MAFGAVIVRLGAVQVGGRRFALVGEAQRMHTATLPAERGAIVDRNGEALAISARRRTVWADPQAVRDPAGAAHALAPLLKVAESEIRAKLTSSGNFVYLARKVDDPVADAVGALHLAGVSLLEEPKRVDPAGTLAAPVLGQVGVDDHGLSGLELQYQKELNGVAGQLVVEKDPDGRDIAAGIHQLQAPVPGKQVQLSLDRSMQYETEQALSDQIVSSHAKAGIAIVMDPTSGEVLSMANLTAGTGGAPPAPTPDNAAVTRVYEPGSVNKLVTVAGAIEDKAVSPTDTFVVPDQLSMAGSTFHDAEPHATETMPVTRIVADSSNVGTIMIAKGLGKERVDHYVRAFGLAGKTSLDFPGESAGLLPKLGEWSGTSLATVPIGQGVAVTALQMLVAYNTIANGGVQVSPILVKRVVDASGTAHEVRPPAPRRVVSEATARAVVPMLQQVVADGTGTAAAVPGYSVAGKTGTAQKAREGGGGYKEGAYVATFAGFLPAASPRLSVIVVLDEPTPIFGGLVSAPLFSELAGFGARLFRVPPDAPLPATGTVSPTAPTTTAPPAIVPPATVSPATTPAAVTGAAATTATPTRTPTKAVAGRPTAAGTLGVTPTSRP
ncbi:MAG: peptidoglycan D,D-transpeptidase FtsI family protein [Acidimicrobiales bacterium]